MDDFCAVCAEPLKWIGYGPCGHREVCFTCIARVRFVLKDKSCCICKQQCPAVFITKALGAYTRVLTDWESLQNDETCSGRRTFWHDKVLEAYFDDEDPFKILKAMCALYCSICERAAGGEQESVANGLMRKGHMFKNIDSLRHHLSTVHKVFMCQLCLESKKVFTSQQKLYSKPQLYQHCLRGDPEVDQNAEDQGGFSGHPSCRFCQKPFYGDNELYQHMSRDHFTCQICQRARPDNHEYYTSYDSLETHFRERHVLCENRECLAKKFVVFPSEIDLKRHNATTHGENMSRSQRHAALQIPGFFEYRRHRQDSTRNRSGQGGHASNARSGQYLATILPVSGGSENLGNAVPELCVVSPASITEPSLPMDSQGRIETSTTDHLEGTTSLIRGSAVTEPRYVAAVVGSRNWTLGDEAFPPLLGSSRCAQRQSMQATYSQASMATSIGGFRSMGSAQAGLRALNTVDASPSPGPSRDPQTVQAHNDFPSTRRNDCIGRAHSKVAFSTSQPPPVSRQRITDCRGALKSKIGTPAREMQIDGNQQSSQNLQFSTEEIRAGNKALVQRIRAELEGREQHFEELKGLSSLYRRGELSSEDYYFYIARIGLLNVVPELARLCPDSRKGKELMELHDAAELTNRHLLGPNSTLPGPAELVSSFSSIVAAPTVHGSGSNSGRCASKAQANIDGRLEVLSTGGYRSIKNSLGTPSPVRVDIMRSSETHALNELAGVRERTSQVPLSAFPPLLPSSSQTPHSVSQKLLGCGAPKPGKDAKGEVSNFVTGSERRAKKPTRFERLRLGKESPVVPFEEENGSKNLDKSQCRGVWKNVGSQRVFP